jgi:trk system potassium uptake protein TrkA
MAKTRVVLVGGDSKAKALSKSLIKKGFFVTAINNDRQACDELATIENLRVMYGDGTKTYALEDADVYDFDLLIAMTKFDDANLVICEIAKKKFNVKKTVAVVSDPRKTDFFYKMGVDRVLCAINSITDAIEQLAFRDQLITTISVADAYVNVSQVPIGNRDPAIGRRLRELSLPNEVVIGCVHRANANIVPRGEFMILEGDILVLISSDDKRERQAVKALTGR